MPELPTARTSRTLLPTRRSPARLSLLALSMLAASALLVPGAVTSQTMAEQQQQQQPLAVQVGAQRELLFDTGVDRIAVANEAVASITLTRKVAGSPAARILVTGKTAGQTTLMVWEKGRSSATTYQVQVQRRSAILEGQLDSLPAHQLARDSALRTQPDKTALVDRSTIGVRSNTVQVEVKIVEFNRNVLKEAGINLSQYGPNSHGFTFQTGPGNAALNALDLVLGFGRANNGNGLNLTLKLLETNGLARLLAEPTLVTLSGHSASFLSGGELPVPVPQGLGTTSIEYKSYGIGLTVTPTVLSNDRIVLKVAPEASELDYGNALAIGNVSVPALTTRRADTTVELGDGESYIIGGLVKRNTTSSVSKVPLLGDIPVLGTLFKSNAYQMNETELVLLVTPRLVKPMARNTDLSPFLPGKAEQRDGAVWRPFVLGGIDESAVPGFSR